MARPSPRPMRATKRFLLWLRGNLHAQWLRQEIPPIKTGIAGCQSVSGVRPAEFQLRKRQTAQQDAMLRSRRKVSILATKLQKNQAGCFSIMASMIFSALITPTMCPDCITGAMLTPSVCIFLKASFKSVLGSKWIAGAQAQALSGV